MSTYLSFHHPNPLVQSQPHRCHKTDPLHRLVAVEVEMNPVQTPHLHQMQENQIIPLIFGAKSDMFIHSNSILPQSVVIVTLYESVVPPLLKICIHPWWEHHATKDLSRECQV